MCLQSPFSEAPPGLWPAQLPSAWSRLSLGGHTFRPIQFQLWSLLGPGWQEPNWRLHES